VNFNLAAFVLEACWGPIAAAVLALAVHGEVERKPEP
jgi:hypothetical protein